MTGRESRLNRTRQSDREKRQREPGCGERWRRSVRRPRVAVVARGTGGGVMRCETSTKEVAAEKQFWHGHQGQALVRNAKALKERCMVQEYRVGDVVPCGTSIVRIHLIDGDRVWHHGTELGESSHGGLVLGWCRRRAEYPVLRRAGKLVAPDAEELCQQAVNLFPGEPWLRFPVNVADKLRPWLCPWV